MRFFYLIKDYYCIYKNTIDFNKNIIISAIVTAICDIIILTMAISFFVDNYLNMAIVSLAGDFLIFNSLFMFLFYQNWNKRKRKIEIPTSEWHVKSMIHRLVTTIGVAEVSYLVTKFSLTYLLLDHTDVMDSTQVSVISTLIAWFVYITSANVMARRTNLFPNCDTQK